MINIFSRPNPQPTPPPAVVTPNFGAAHNVDEEIKAIGRRLARMETRLCILLGAHGLDTSGRPLQKNQ